MHNIERLYFLQQRHEPICAKSQSKQRKTFDSSKQRAEGTEIKDFKQQQRRMGGGRAAASQKVGPNLHV